MKVSLKYFGVAFLIWVIGAMTGVVLTVPNLKSDNIHSQKYSIEQEVSDALSINNANQQLNSDSLF